MRRGVAECGFAIFMGEVGRTMPSVSLRLQGEEPASSEDAGEHATSVVYVSTDSVSRLSRMPVAALVIDLITARVMERS